MEAIRLGNLLSSLLRWRQARHSFSDREVQGGQEGNFGKVGSYECGMGA